MPKIYTKTGDGGITSLYDGTRMGKDAVFFDILGSNDELTSRIGMVYAILSDQTPNNNNYNDILPILRNIQQTLQDINSNIARAKVNIDDQIVEILEGHIDTMTAKLPPLTKFILPGERILDAHIHLCRTQTRKVERDIWTMNRSNEVDPVICRYINRLSDFFFTLARWTLI